MTEYTKLDDLIVKRIGEGWTEFTGIFAREVREEAERLERAGKGEAFRVIDRRLQAMRKKGELSYARKTGWQVAHGVRVLGQQEESPEDADGSRKDKT